jgi:hypothetical protein
MCESTYGHGVIIQFMSVNKAVAKNVCTTWLYHTKYTSFDIIPVHMNCTLGMYQRKVKEINYEIRGLFKKYQTFGRQKYNYLFGCLKP